MVKDGEIVYPGTELTQSGELPPRKGMDFKTIFFFVLFFFFCIVMMKMEFKFHAVTKLWCIVTDLYNLQVS